MKKLLAIASILTMSAASALTFAANSSWGNSSQDIITWGHNNGITKYETQADFRADMPVTREQAAKMITTWLGGHHNMNRPMTDGTDCTFTDMDKVDPTLSYSIENACAYGLFKGYKGEFMPKQMLTKRDTVTLMNRAISMLPSYSSLSDKIPAVVDGYLSRGELLNGLYHIDAVVTAQIDTDKTVSLQAAQTELNAQMAKWEAKNIVNYSVKQQLSCFCLPNSTHPISFDVASGAVVTGSVQDANETDKIPASELLSTPMTVVQAFAMIQDAIDRKADSITVEYDAELGNPTTMNFDYSVMMADEEQFYTYEVTSLN